MSRATIARLNTAALLVFVVSLTLDARDANVAIHGAQPILTNPRLTHDELVALEAVVRVAWHAQMLYGLIILIMVVLWAMLVSAVLLPSSPHHHHKDKVEEPQQPIPLV